MEADLNELKGLGPAACMGPISGMITSTGFIHPSEVLELPDYQKNAVEGYMKSDAYHHWPFQPNIDLPGRGIPDVSAYGTNIPFVSEAENGNLMAYPTSGTRFVFVSNCFLFYFLHFPHHLFFFFFYLKFVVLVLLLLQDFYFKYLVLSFLHQNARVLI